MVLVIDYGAGNIASVKNCLQELGYTFKIQSSMHNEKEFRSLILPGVGDASYMMSCLYDLNLVEPIKQWVMMKKALLGICVGAEVLLSYSEEGADNHQAKDAVEGTKKSAVESTVACLDLIAGTCKRFQAEGTSYKIPHMGWNSVCIVQEDEKLFTGIRTESDFYFVHSYYLDPRDSKNSIGKTTYKDTFSSIIKKDKLIGMQFHPEKSGKDGLQILDNFLRYY